MRQFLAVSAVVAFLAAVPVSHLALGAKGGNSNKVAICHVTGVDEGDLPDDPIDDVATGHVIEVSDNGNAVAAHLNHGDCLAAAGAQGGDDCTCP